MSRAMYESVLLGVRLRVTNLQGEVSQEMSSEQYISNWVNWCQHEHNHQGSELLEERDLDTIETSNGIATRLLIKLTCEVCSPVSKNRSRRRRGNRIPSSFRKMAEGQTDLPEEPKV